MSKENFLALGKKVKGLTLLYIEDNKGLQQQATKVFKKIFKNIIAVDNGEDALAYFKKYKFRNESQGFSVNLFIICFWSFFVILA